MKIIYPTDWGIIGKSPEIVISEVRNYRKITPLLSKVVDGKFIPIDDIEFVEHRSSNGSVRLYQWPDLSEDGAYIVGFTRAIASSEAGTSIAMILHKSNKRR